MQVPSVQRRSSHSPGVQRPCWLFRAVAEGGKFRGWARISGLLAAFNVQLRGRCAGLQSCPWSWPQDLWSCWGRSLGKGSWCRWLELLRGKNSCKAALGGFPPFLCLAGAGGPGPALRGLPGPPWGAALAAGWQQPLQARSGRDGAFSPALPCPGAAGPGPAKATAAAAPGQAAPAPGATRRSGAEPAGTWAPLPRREGKRTWPGILLISTCVATEAYRALELVPQVVNIQS